MPKHSQEIVMTTRTNIAFAAVVVAAFVTSALTGNAQAYDNGFDGPRAGVVEGHVAAPISEFGTSVGVSTGRDAQVRSLGN